MSKSRSLSCKVLIAGLLFLLLLLPMFSLFDFETDAATGKLYEQVSIVSGNTYVIAGLGIQANGDTTTNSYCISSETAYSDGLKHVKTPTENPSDDLLWTITAEGDGKYSIYSVKKQRYLTLQGDSIILSTVKQPLTIENVSGKFQIYLDKTHYLRFTNVDPGSRWHCGSYSRNFTLYSFDKGYAEYRETDTPVLTVSCFSDMHHEYGLQYNTASPLRGSSKTAYTYAKSVTNGGKGADVVLIGGDISGRRNTATGGATWNNGGYGDDGSKVIKNMMEKNFAAFQTASRDGKVLIATGNHDPEPSVNMATVGDNKYPQVNGNDWQSYTKAAVGAPIASASYADLGLSTTDVPSQYRTETLCYLYRIKGMYFLGLNTPFGDHIAVSQQGSNGLYVQQVEWAERQLASIGKDKTVVLLCHYPATSVPTVTTPKGKVDENNSTSAALAKMKEVLNNYPNIIYAYGHHHAGDAQTLHQWAGEKIAPSKGLVRLKNNAFLSDGWIHTYMGSLGYYSYSLQPGGLTADDIKVVQFLNIEFYSNHITFKYYNSGTNVVSGASREIESLTIYRDLSSQLGVAKDSFDTTLYGADSSAPDSSDNAGGNVSSGSNSGSVSGGSGGVNPSHNGNDSSDPTVDSGAGYIPDEPEFEAPVIDTEVNATQPEENVWNANLGGTADELKAATLKDFEMDRVESGESVKIRLETEDRTNLLTDEDKALLAGKGKGTPAVWIELFLTSQVGDEADFIVETSASPLSVALTVPEALRNTDPKILRTYTVQQIVRGDLVELTARYDSATGMLVFETSDFSNVVVAYVDREAPVQSETSDNVDSGSTVTDTPDASSSGKTDSAASDLPAEEESSALTVILIACGAAVLLAGGFCVWFFLLRKKTPAKE